jgi:hypothetical protein
VGGQVAKAMKRTTERAAIFGRPLLLIRLLYSIGCFKLRILRLPLMFS